MSLRAAKGIRSRSASPCDAAASETVDSWPFPAAVHSGLGRFKTKACDKLDTTSTRRDVMGWGVTTVRAMAFSFCAATAAKMPSHLAAAGWMASTAGGRRDGGQPAAGTDDTRGGCRPPARTTAARRMSSDVNDTMRPPPWPSWPPPVNRNGTPRNASHSPSSTRLSGNGRAGDGASRVGGGGTVRVSVGAGWL